jgi:hypothetical protein
MRTSKRTPLDLPNAAEWQCWTESVQRNLSELTSPPEQGMPDEEVQGWLLVERALQLSSMALEAMQSQPAMH